MTVIFYRNVGTRLRRGSIIADNMDGTFNVRPTGWTRGHIEVRGNNIFKDDEVVDMGGRARHIFKVKAELEEE